jgi:hypothetical protein
MTLAAAHPRDFLVPHLEVLGYAGVYTNKQGKVREGSATFWRASRFTRLITRDMRMRELFKEVRPVLLSVGFLSDKYLFNLRCLLT